MMTLAERIERKRAILVAVDAWAAAERDHGHGDESIRARDAMLAALDSVLAELQEAEDALRQIRDCEFGARRS